MWPKTALVLDAVQYHLVDITEIPSAVAEVPVTLVDNGQKFATVMVAGLVGSRLTCSKGPSADAPDTLSPVAGWWIYISKTDDELPSKADIRRQDETDTFQRLDFPRCDGGHAVVQDTSLASPAQTHEVPPRRWRWSDIFPSCLKHFSG
jgi:hypothetical protein